MIKQTVTALIFRGNDILAVSRKDNHNDFGLCGGKLDDTDDSLETAIIREVKEETGLDIINPMPFFKRIHTGRYGDEYECTCFLVESYSGEINTKEAGVVKWSSFDEINEGCFGEYNKKLQLKIMKMWSMFKLLQSYEDFSNRVIQIKKV
jgi:8-oxo-dGTP diphosphatase